MSNHQLLPPRPSDSSDADTNEAAIELIRSKVARVFRDEPDASEEIAEVKQERTPSKHQRYMQELSASGKSLADIQTAWHHYYVTLPDTEKHEVWQEFYEANQHTPYQKLFQKQVPIASRQLPQAAPETHSRAQPLELPAATLPSDLPAFTAENSIVIASHELPTSPKASKKAKKPGHSAAATQQLKQKIANRVSAGGKLKAKHHLQSLLFGLGTGAIVMLVLLFSFFNQYIIAPFIQPSRTVSSTPIILSDTASIAGGPPQVIIPKINVQIPLDFSIQTNDENAIEDALESGVVHYPSTVMPGQPGNSAFFGHSSNNIFNPGKYKFAFVLLHTLTTGDIFYITYNGQAYAYQVFAREIVPPSQVSVLNDSKGKTNTVTLITCDPPGTSRNRLVVWGEQISPAPAGTTAAVAPTKSVAPKQLADNGPSLWSRMVRGVQFWR